MKSPPSFSAVAAASSSASAHATRCRSTPPRLPSSSPTSGAARSISAAPTHSPNTSPPNSRRPACATTVSTSNPSPSDMRRSPIVLAATVAGTTGVLAFHAHSPASVRAAATASTTTKTSSGSGSATGDAVDTRYGPAQVKVTVSGGKITAIEAVQLQSNDPRSQMISGSAEPVLKQEVLSKQSADVDVVSGATYTSASYLQSLQSALDKVGYKAPDGSTATAQVPG